MGDTSIDVDAIAGRSADDTDPLDSRPIMILLKNLICNKQNTVTTNAQIIDILQKEFDINIDSRHELEVDIYIKIIKKYLKDWPQWEELEQVSARLHSLKDYEAVQKVLNYKYKNLKEYLSDMLNIAKYAIAHAEYKDVFNDKQESENVDTNDVVMEVHCSRDELNHLICRRPKTNTVFKYSIFNTANIEPSRILSIVLSPEQILNLWSFKISIYLPWFVYNRELTYNYEHTLVNKARKTGYDQTNSLQTIWQMKINNGRYKMRFHKQQILNDIKNIISISKKYQHSSEFIEVLLKVVMSELSEGPDKYEVPCMLRKYCNKFKYMRSLYVENDDHTDGKFDLRIEEMVSPVIQYNIGKLLKSDSTLPVVEEWLKIECLVCKVKFAGSSDVQEMIMNHYKDYHVNNEPDWQCSRCKRIFGIIFLAENKWHHEC